MDGQRVKTPPVVDWLVVSVSGSSDEGMSEDEFVFGGVSVAVEELKDFTNSEWTYKSSEGFHINSRSKSDESVSEGRDRNGMENVCKEIKKNIKSIGQDYNDNVNYLEQFRVLSELYDKIQEEIRD